MTGRVVNLPRVRAALARLDAVVVAYPELCGAAARERLRAFVAEHQVDLDGPEHQVDLDGLAELAVDAANDANHS